VFLRINPVTGVGCALKSKKLSPCLFGLYEIIERVGKVAYRIVELEVRGKKIMFFILVYEQLYGFSLIVLLMFS